MVTLVEWARSFNEERDTADQIRFHGIDVQNGRPTLSALHSYLETVDPEFLATVRDDLETIADGCLPPQYDDHCEVRVETANAVLGDVLSRLKTNQTSYVAATSQRAWRIACQYVTVIEYAVEDLRDGGDDLDDLRERVAGFEASVTEGKKSRLRAGAVGSGTQGSPRAGRLS